MDDWLTAGIGAWLGNRWVGPWGRLHPQLSIGIFIVGTAASVAILLLLA